MTNELPQMLDRLAETLRCHKAMTDAATDFDSDAFERAKQAFKRADEAFWANAVPAPRARERSQSALSPPVGLRPLSQGAGR